MSLKEVFMDYDTWFKYNNLNKRNYNDRLVRWIFSQRYMELVPFLMIISIIFVSLMVILK